MANLWGVMLMSLVLNFLSLRGYFGTFDDAFFGAILIGMMLFAPTGLLHASRLRAMAKAFARLCSRALRRTRVPATKDKE